MDWLRWWHGTVNDPKFGWVARKSGQTVASVVAVWACLLECASTATQGNADATRGDVASFDCNVADVLLGLDDGSVEAIYSAMVQKNLITEGRLVKWDERQPKREDSGNPNTGALSSTERSRLRRERLKHETTDATEAKRNATQGNDREDKSRGDKKEEANASVDSGVSTPGVDLLGDASGDNGSTGDQSGQEIPTCPVQQIVALYHSCMPQNPRARIVDDKRKKSIRARWKQAAELVDVGPFGYSTGAEGIEAWKQFFKVCAASDFLTGKSKPQPGKPPFVADIDFLMSPDGFKKALENKYHREVKE